MVQDCSPSPEFYLSELSGSRCGGWSLADAESVVTEDDHQPAPSLLKERTTVYVVSIPGDTDDLEAPSSQDNLIHDGMS
jgi:hypothetical protein